MARQGALREEPLYLSDDAAGQAAAGIARRLRGKVVRVAVQDHGPPDYLVDRESIGQKRAPGVSLSPEKGRQIARVLGMRAVSRIEMAFRVGEGIRFRSGTASALMDMESKETPRAAVAGYGKAVYLREH